MSTHPSASPTALRSRQRVLRWVAQKALSLLGIGAMIAATASSASPTLQSVMERGSVRCGVNPDLPGFSRANSLGKFAGLDIDICRAVAAAVLGDADAIDAQPLGAMERFSALVDGKVDVLSRNTSWTLEREARYGEFAAISFYDGQGFMVSVRSGIQSALELDNLPVCVLRGTTFEHNARDFFSLTAMRYRPVFHASVQVAARAFARGECAALTLDRAALAAERSVLPEPQAYRLLPELISKEPLGPMVATGDPGWTKIVRWTLNCMINAEELGVSQTGLASGDLTRSPAVRRLLGEEGRSGAMLGLAANWCARVVRQVGNYAESYERHVGEQTALGLKRGVNALWTHGGLLYAPPIR